MPAVYSIPSSRTRPKPEFPHLDEAEIVALDDSPEAIRLLQRAFQGSGARFFGFTEAESFFNYIRDAKPDVALLDIVMPGLDGLEVFARLRDAPETARLPVAFLSSALEPADEARPPVEGERVITLSKPFSRKGLLGRIDELLART